MTNEFARAVVVKEGPSFTVLQSCADCKYFNPGLGKCEELDVLLNSRLPNENCKFLVNSSIKYFNSEISRLKNKDKIKVLNILKDIFPDSYDMEYDENKVSILNEDFDENDAEKLKTRLSDYSFHIRPDGSDSFRICLTRKPDINLCK